MFLNKFINLEIKSILNAIIQYTCVSNNKINMHRVSCNWSNYKHFFLDLQHKRYAYNYKKNTIHNNNKVRSKNGIFVAAV